MNTSAAQSSSSVFNCSAVIPRVPAQITASFIPAIARLSVVGCFLADRTGLCKLLPRYLLSCVAYSDPSALRHTYLSAPQQSGYTSSPGEGMLECRMLLDSCLD